MNIYQYQKECEDAFLLECSIDDIKEDKDAKKLWKFIKRQRRRVNKIRKLEYKLLCENRW